MAQPIVSIRHQQAGFTHKPSDGGRPQLPLLSAAAVESLAPPCLAPKGLGVAPRCPPGLFSEKGAPQGSFGEPAANDSGSDHESTTASGASMGACSSDGHEATESDDGLCAPPGLETFRSPVASPQGGDSAAPGARRIDGEMLPVPPGLLPPPEAPSHGSTLHAAGQCRPCNWFWKPGGCNFGVDCSCCHLCPATELKTRKKGKYAQLRSGRGGLPLMVAATPVVRAR